MDLKIREMLVTLKKYIDGVVLPPEVKRMVLKDIYDTVSAEADRAVREEIESRDTAERREDDE